MNYSNIFLQAKGWPNIFEAVTFSVILRTKHQSANHNKLQLPALIGVVYHDARYSV